MQLLRGVLKKGTREGEILVRRKKWTAGIMAGVMIACVLVGCGQKEQEEIPPPASVGTPETEEKTEASGTTVTDEGIISGKLTINLWDNEYAGQAAIEAFQKAYPDVEVTLNLTPFLDYQSKLFTSLAGGETMDVFFMRENETYQAYIEKGLCMPLDDMIENNQFDMSVYENYADQIKYKGKVYSMPYRTGGYHLYYNKDLFDAAGVPYPDGTYTWDEFRDVARKLTSGDGADKVHGLYMMGWPWMQLFQAMQEGVTIVDDDYNIDLDCDEVRRSLEWYYGTCVEDGSQITPAEATATNASITPLFVAGKTAMILAGDYMAGNLKNNMKDGNIAFEWGMTHVPCNEGVEYSTQSIVTKACINAKAQNPELAFLFLSFLSGEEGQNAVAAAGSKPALGTEEIKKTFKDNIEVYSDEQIDLYFENVKVFTEPLNLAAPYASTILTEEFSLYMTQNGQDLETTINNCVTRLQEEIDQLDLD